MAPHPRPRLSVVIPTLNEVKRLPSLLTRLARLNGVDEVIVCDGSSDDGTPELVARSTFPGKLRLERAPRGRARQLNRGAEVASGELLLFLHADTLPPLDTAYWVRRTLAQPGVVAGAFKTWHLLDDTLHATQQGDAAASSHPWWLHLADLRSRYTGLPYGDQGLFLSRTEFARAGGYPDQPLMEDLEFSLRLRRRGKIRTAPSCMLVSGRRFEANPLRDTCLVNAFPTLYRLGVPPSRLASWYRDTR